jgi:hypothetical protein
MELVDYLKRHSGFDDGTCRNHKKAISFAVERLHLIIGCSNFEIFQEVSLLDNGLLIGRTDLAILTDNEMFLAEAKVIDRGNKKSSRNLMNNQLWRGYGYFKDYFRIAPRMIGITYTRKANGINHYEIQRPIEDARIFMRRI